MTTGLEVIKLLESQNFYWSVYILCKFFDQSKTWDMSLNSGNFFIFSGQGLFYNFIDRPETLFPMSLCDGILMECFCEWCFLLLTFSLIYRLKTEKKVPFASFYTFGFRELLSCGYMIQTYIYINHYRLENNHKYSHSTTGMIEFHI
jgi:hypothetical protein